MLAAPSARAGAPEEVLVDGIPHVRNGSEPLEGTQTIELEELWRVGGDDDDELLFGMIGQVLQDDEGNVYILDRQLSEVKVLSADGEFLRTLSREGEGPGETRRPRDMLMLDDGSLGIVQMMPGRIVGVGLDGTPGDNITPGGEGEAGGFSALFNAWSRDGNLLICGEKMVPRPPGVIDVTRYLARIATDGTEEVRLIEKQSERDMQRFVWDEGEDYFVQHGGLALGAKGRVYAAPVRDRYQVQVYALDGTIERVIEREFTPRKRNQDDKDRVSNTMRMVINGREVPKEIADTDPCIDQLWVDDAEQLWVLSSRSDRDQPDGVFQIYDIFDERGRFVRQTAVTCPGDPLEDGLFLLGKGRAILVRGLVASAVAMVGEAGGDDTADEGDPPVLEVICYRMKMQS
jgi:hypothetical protein